VINGKKQPHDELVASELQQTWNRPDAQEWAAVYTKIFPAY
jgi:hypothetical protein